MVASLVISKVKKRLDIIYPTLIVMLINCTLNLFISEDQVNIYISNGELYFWVYINTGRICAAQICFNYLNSLKVSIPITIVNVFISSFTIVQNSNADDELDW